MHLERGASETERKQQKKRGERTTVHTAIDKGNNINQQKKQQQTQNHFIN